MGIYTLKIWRCKICRSKDENKGEAENTIMVRVQMFPKVTDFDGLYLYVWPG